MFDFFKKKNNPAVSNSPYSDDAKSYPEVPDWDHRSEQLTAFRAAYNDFLGKRGVPENAPIQQYSTQLLWHTLLLQKKRLERLGLTLAVETTRSQRKANPQESIAEASFFDGRYVINAVNEDLFVKRIFHQGEQLLGVFVESDSANYSILSAKTQGDSEIICPNCGSSSTREDLLDGCDYCGTRFSIEDLSDKIGSFGLQFDLGNAKDNQMIRETHRKLDEQSAYFVHSHDPLFSIQVFSESIYNKLAAIHYAESEVQVNAFSSIDLQQKLNEYKNVVNTDLWHIRIDHFKIEDNMQIADIQASLVLFELVDEQVQLRNEVANIQLQKSADCVSQIPGGPTITQCKGCGTSLLLMEGKTCRYCGNELNMADHDWVITEYSSLFGDFGNSWRET